MNDLPLRWKLFKAVCIIQLVLVSIRLVLAAGALFFGPNRLYGLVGTLVYAILFLFLMQGLSLLNYHYPDTPLPSRPKRIFNWLFLLNFGAISFLFAELVNEWKAAVPLISEDLSLFQLLLVGYGLLSAILVFLFHLLFLAGMFRLRQTIHANSMQNWKDLLEENKFRN